MKISAWWRLLQDHRQLQPSTCNAINSSSHHGQLRHLSSLAVNVFMWMAYLVACTELLHINVYAAGLRDSTLNLTNSFTDGTCLLDRPYTMTTKHRHSLRDQAKEMFDHGFSSYMKYAYPEDELNPLLCKGRSRDADFNNWNVNDVLGNFSLTLVDTLDTLAILGDQTGFENAVKSVIDTVQFDLDSRVQVFEVTIRVLGGLLSAHLLATDRTLGYRISWYNNELLDLAIDLGNRLMPAFKTPTGIPYPRVNLRKGVLSNEIKETCTAGAGTLVLEFGTLSRLSGDPKYENAARTALFAVWARRSDLDLVGNTMSIITNRWVHNAASIGAGIDSFYEYLLKAHVLFGDEEYAEMFDKAYAAVMKWVKHEHGFYYRNINMDNGNIVAPWVDSLAAFFPGLQVLAGDLQNAIKNHYLYFSIWKRYGGLPERFNVHSRTIDIESYPLRPELIESTYLLYQATKDPFYLYAGEVFLNDLNMTARTSCGFASIRDVRTGAQDNRMESFFLSETLKYLYLLFDEENSVNKLDSNFVFTTEGHFLPLPYKYFSGKAFNNKSLANQSCPTMQKLNIVSHSSLSRLPPLSLNDISQCDSITGYQQPPTTDHTCSPRGLYTKGDYFSAMNNDLPSYLEIIVPFRSESPNRIPMLAKTLNGVVADSLQGVTVSLEVTKSNTYRIVRLNRRMKIGPKQIVKVPRIGVPYSIPLADTSQDAVNAMRSPRLGTLITLLGSPSTQKPLELSCALFGPILSHATSFTPLLIPLLDDALHDKYTIQLQTKSLRRKKLTLKRISVACSPLSSGQQRRARGRFVLVRRGGCSFAKKIENLQVAGAVGAIVVSFTEERIRMVPSDDTTEGYGRHDGVDTIAIPAFSASKSVGLQLLAGLPTYADEVVLRPDATVPLYALSVAVNVIDADISEASIANAPVMKILNREIENLYIVELRRALEDSLTSVDSSFRPTTHRGLGLLWLGSHMDCLFYSVAKYPNVCCSRIFV
ncbi:hypothetical protein BASA50_009470 [Batrachochytrium salamandrivorans]|uniref:alpha-1,2-Mannosidase n=1 Tax=Batrachochytrium salamandrivorans TaxID=1357716 RepID=A0ABQ8F1K9_9FUNG|nr:hypothetical protein BASA50_009470 [Batrachochytrium salamandrivorans]